MSRLEVAGAKSIGALVISFVVYIAGIVNEAVVVLVFFMIMDMISGLLRAWLTKSLNSTLGTAGIIKKIAIMMLVGMAGGLEYIMISVGQDPKGIIVLGVTSFFIVNECISILENCAQIGAPIPPVLYNALEKLNKEPFGKEQVIKRNPHLEEMDRIQLIKENEVLQKEIVVEKANKILGDDESEN